MAVTSWDGLGHPPGTIRAARRSRATEICWDTVDQAPALLWIAGLAVIGALLMAVLGLPPVDLHGPLHRFWGIMDPLCGGTRAAYWMGRGRLDQAWLYNPGIVILAVGVAGVYARAFVGRLRGRWLTVRVRRAPMVAIVVVALVVLEIQQQLNAALLMRT